MKPKYNISFSGGRTSGYMTKLLIDKFHDQYDFIVTFANTGLEHEETLVFVNNCDKYFGFKTVWLEAVTNEGRNSTTHKIVSFETAAREGEPFHESIKKYGIPNVSFPFCTRELKLNVMRSYLKSIGINHKKIPTAIGIRIDEDRRVSKSASYDNLKYPLISPFPTDKSEVLYWWSQQKFDLGIEEFEGNCLGCFKKSQKKLFMQIRQDPNVFNWHLSMENLYRFVGPQEGMRVFFRGNLDTVGLFKLHKHLGDHMFAQQDLFSSGVEENGGCSESCEIYPMEKP